PDDERLADAMLRAWGRGCRHAFARSSHRSARWFELALTARPNTPNPNPNPRPNPRPNGPSERPEPEGVQRGLAILNEYVNGCPNPQARSRPHEAEPRRLAAHHVEPALPGPRQGDRLAVRRVRLRGPPEGGGRGGRDRPLRARVRRR